MPCGSMSLNSSLNVSFQSVTASFSAATFSFGRVSTATALKGMALRMLPPCHEQRRASSSSMAWRTTCTSSLLALARPSLISSPLCPPRSPCTAMATAASSGSVSASLYSSVAVTSMPPAEPMTNLPQCSESRLSRMSPCSSPSGRSLAPYMPVSSSAVMSASMGPCLRLLSSMTAMMAATPSPLSAPRVVPRAFTHSPSIHGSMGSVSKLCVDSGVFCGTMSMCACSMMPLRPSMPGVAGLRMCMLPAGSFSAKTPASLAKLSRNCCILSKCPLGRGTCVSL